MKKTLLALALGASLFTDAAASEVEFSYVTGAEDYFGTLKKENFDVAVFLPGDAFEGFRVKSVAAQINAAKGIECYQDFSVWLSTELKTEEKQNIANVGSYEATLSDDGTLSGVLPESYTITSDGVYVGYSFSVKTLNSASKYPIGIGAADDSNAYFIHSNRSYLNWTNLSTKGYGCALTVTLESDNMPARSITIGEIENPIYLKVGESKNIPVTLVFTGSEAVKSVDIDYSINGNNYSATCEASVVPGINKRFEVSLEIPAMNETFASESEFKVVKVNGESNEASNPQYNVMVVARENMPVRQTLYEEYTGTWCGYCPRGYAALEYIKKNYPDFVVASYHNGDAMTVTNSYPSSVPGYPGAALNREVICDPYYGSQTYEGVVPVVEEMLAMNEQFTPWNISVTHKWENDDLLTATAHVSNIGGLEKGGYKIAYILVADGLSGTSSKWSQSNYYASMNPNPDEAEELNNFCKGGIYGKSSVSGLVFDDVVISSTGIFGVGGSIPETLAPDEEAEYSLSFDLSKINASLLPDKNKLRIVAAIVDASGKVWNCAKTEVNDFVPNAVESIANDNAPVEYFNLDGMKVENPAGGIFIRKQGNKTWKVVIN